MNDTAEVAEFTMFAEKVGIKEKTYEYINSIIDANKICV